MFRYSCQIKKILGTGICNVMLLVLGDFCYARLAEFRGVCELIDGCVSLDKLNTISLTNCPETLYKILIYKVYKKVNKLYLKSSRSGFLKGLIGFEIGVF